MAIDQRGQVTTTGMMNKSNMNLQVPDMSNLVEPQQVDQDVAGLRYTPKGVTVDEAIATFKKIFGRDPVNLKEVEEFYKNRSLSEKPTQPKEPGIVESIQRNVTAEDMTVLAPVLSPSVKNVLVKILPDIAPLMEGIGPDEETVPVKVSTFASLPGDIQDFIIESSTEQMDTNNVQLDTPSDTKGIMSQQESELPETPEEGMDYDQIDGIDPDIDLV